MTTTNYIWDEQNYLAETDQNNVVQTVYTNEPEQYGNLVSSRISGTTSYHHFDAIGSTRQLTNSAGTVTDTVIYDAWGNITTRTGATGNFCLWVGRVQYYFDAETGQTYIRERVYGPLIGRWTAVDTLRILLNLFIYAMNSPVGRSDPSGMQAANAAVGVKIRRWETNLVGGKVDLLDDGLPGYKYQWSRITDEANIPPGVTHHWQLNTIKWDCMTTEGRYLPPTSYVKDVTSTKGTIAAEKTSLVDKQFFRLSGACFLWCDLDVEVIFGFPKNKDVEPLVDDGLNVPALGDEPTVLRNDMDPISKGTFDVSYKFADFGAMKWQLEFPGFRCIPPCVQPSDGAGANGKTDPAPAINCLPCSFRGLVIEAIKTPWGEFKGELRRGG